MRKHPVRPGTLINGQIEKETDSRQTPAKESDGRPAPGSAPDGHAGARLDHWCGGLWQRTKGISDHSHRRGRRVREASRKGQTQENLIATPRRRTFHRGSPDLYLTRPCCKQFGRFHMKSNVTEVAANVYRSSTFHPDYQIQFNQYLIKDDEPFLMHTGFRKMFDVTRDAVVSVIDPSRLRWFGFSHFESDECGALNDCLKVWPEGQAVCSLEGEMGLQNNLSDLQPRPLKDV